MSLCSSSPTVNVLLQVRLIWPGRLTVPKLLYYINRYFSITWSLYRIPALFIFSERPDQLDTIVRNFHLTISKLYLLDTISCLSFSFLCDLLLCG